MEGMSEELEPFGEDSKRVDALIWKYVGVKPVREIAEMAGIKPEEVLRRKNEMLDEIDVLTIQQKRAKFIVELDGMARDARGRADSISDEFYAGTVNASVGAIKAVLSELARMEKSDDSKIEALNQLRVRELFRLVDSTVSKTFAEIAQKHDLDEEELMEMFQGHLVVAAHEMEAGLE